MADTEQFTIGAKASCSDGVCGEVSRVVVDPLAHALTHLVVEPAHRLGLGRLVPLSLVDVSEGGIRLRCTMAEFAHVLLQEGHLWGRRQLAIPISAVTGAGDGVRLRITKQEVRDLPPVDVDHADG
jgi:hypothetical protein